MPMATRVYSPHVLGPLARMNDSTRRSGAKHMSEVIFKRCGPHTEKHRTYLRSLEITSPKSDPPVGACRIVCSKIFPARGSAWLLVSTWSQCTIAARHSICDSTVIVCCHSLIDLLFSLN